jgi:zinc transport system substrate-binding protein
MKQRIVHRLSGIPFAIFVLLLIGVLTVIAYWFFVLRVPRMESRRVTIVTTLFPYYDFARAVAGEDADIVLLLPPGMEAHGYEPKPSDVLQVQHADIFVYTGSFMEPWAESILEGTENEDRRVINASEGLILIEGEDHAGEIEEHATTEPSVEMLDPGSDGEQERMADEVMNRVDPHIWLDFNNAIKITNRIAAELKNLDPANAEAYERRRQAFESELLHLDSAYAETLRTCRTRTFVQGGHRSFGYLARRYNLDYLAAIGFGGDTEPTVKDLLDLINIVREKGIRYIYSEELTSPRYAETLGRETGTTILLLNAAHNLSRNDFEMGVTFTDIMRANLEKLAQGLECE